MWHLVALHFVLYKTAGVERLAKSIALNGLALALAFLLPAERGLTMPCVRVDDAADLPERLTTHPIYL